MHARLLGFGLAFAVLLSPAVVFAANAVPYDVQCWRGMGLADEPPPGSLAALVEQCVEGLEQQAATIENLAEREMRKQVLLARARMQAVPFLRVRSVVPYRATVVQPLTRQRLPSVTERGMLIKTSRQQQLRRREWAYLPEDLRTRALIINRSAARDCLVRTDIPLYDCVLQAIESGRQNPVMDALPVEYRDQKEVTVPFGQTVVTDDGITLQPLRVAGDSRCLVGGQCLWSGEATISAKVFSQVAVDAINNPTLAAPRTLTIPGTDPSAYAPPTGANTVKVGQCTVAFARLLPYPTLQQQVTDESLTTATFVIVHPDHDAPCVR